MHATTQQPSGHHNHFLLLFGVVASVVSIFCEAMFFIEFVEHWFDKTLAAATAIALVGCQFTFVASVVKSWKHNKWLSLGLALVTLALFSVSVAGTASFFESRFSVNQQSSTQGTDEYQLQKRIAESFLNQNSALNDNSKAEKEKGNNWNAGRQLIAAQRATNDAQQALDKLKTITPITQSSTDAMGKLAGEYRWYVWIVIAALVDVCPLFCFALLTDVRTEKEGKTQPQTQAETGVVHTEAPSNTLTDTATPLDALPEVSEMAQKVRGFILADETGVVPSKRKAMDELKRGHGTIKTAYDELVSVGFLINVSGNSDSYEINRNFA